MLEQLKTPDEICVCMTHLPQLSIVLDANSTSAGWQAWPMRVMLDLAASQILKTKAGPCSGQEAATCGKAATSQQRCYLFIAPQRAWWSGAHTHDLAAEIDR